MSSPCLFHTIQCEFFDTSWNILKWTYLKIGKVNSLNNVFVVRTFYLPLKAITRVSLKIFSRQQTASLGLELSEVTDPDFFRKMFSICKHWRKGKHFELHLLEDTAFNILRFIRNVKSISWKSWGFPIISFISDDLFKNQHQFWTKCSLIGKQQELC